MARMMLKSPGNAAWMRDGSARGARRGWASAVWLIAGTLAVALTSYSLSLKVSGERRETDRIARQNNALESELKALDAELRVRMRMPQLQRWNDDILGMVPISASQYLSNPMHLANYGTPLPVDVPALPSVQLAVRDVPLSSSTVQPMLVSAPGALGATGAPGPTGPVVRPGQAALPIDPLLVAAPAPTRPVRPVASQAASNPAAARRAAASETAPDDLLRQVEMTFQGQPGNP